MKSFHLSTSSSLWNWIGAYQISLFILSPYPSPVDIRWRKELNPHHQSHQSQPSKPPDRVGSTISLVAESIENPWNHRIMLQALFARNLFCLHCLFCKGFPDVDFYLLRFSFHLVSIYLFIAFLNKICLALVDGSGGRNRFGSQYGDFGWRCWLHGGSWNWSSIRWRSSRLSFDIWVIC